MEPRSAERGFTMVEIALCLAIIGFALVAIIGVLPTGLNVQRDNREETLVNQDATYLIEAIRSGAQGIDDLTNYVEEVQVDSGGTRSMYVYGTGPSNFRDGRQVLSLLSVPKYLPAAPGVTNAVNARLRSIAGSVAERPRGGGGEMAFRYWLTSEVVPFDAFYWDTNQVETGLVATNLAKNLYELRLTFRWPAPPNYTSADTNYVFPNRQVFRALLTGQLEPAPPLGFLFQPQVYKP